MSKPILLIVDDNQEFVASLQRAFRQEYTITYASSPDDVLRHLDPSPDVVLLDLCLKEEEGNQDGVAVLKNLRQKIPDVPVLMATAYGDFGIVIECTKLGAVDFIEKSRANLHEIKARVARALEQAPLLRRVSDLERELLLIEPREMVGNSEAIKEIKKIIEAVAKAGNVTVLIQGESGTGKELVARAIHANGRRKSGPFAPVVLSALPTHIIEAELFGYEAGAFTDARKRHIGYLEKADSGVLFLDEIGELEVHLQLKLLRFLEERSFQRLGSTRSIPVDIQIVAATNADLKARISEAKFREDLYFRLAGVEVRLPPLRERHGDIPLLVNHFLDLFRRQGQTTKAISPGAMDLIIKYSWPGNIRQMKNALESALFRAIYREHPCVESEDLPDDLRLDQPTKSGSFVQPVLADNFSLDEAMAKTELSFIEQALRKASGKKTKAWKLLGLNDRFALRRRVKRTSERYPQLLSEFPLVRRSYEGDGGTMDEA